MASQMTGEDRRPRLGGARNSGGGSGAYRVALLLAGAALAAVAGCAVVALAATRMGAGHGFTPLMPAVYGPFAVVGVIGGWAGWSLVHRRCAQPLTVLKVLVPVVAIASLAPDLLLLALRFIPGTTTAGVAALMTMHLVVTAAAVPSYVLASRPRRVRRAPATSDLASEATVRSRLA
jgi:hypothetical protein